MAARQRFLLEADIEDVKTGAKLQAAVDTASSALIGFDNAIAVLTNSIAEVDGKLAIEKQIADRKEASEKLAAQILLVDEMLPAWLQISRNLAAALEAIHWRFESVQMGAFVRNCASEVQNAASLTSDDLHAAVVNIRDGHQEIPREPEVFVPPPVEPKPALVQVFTLHAVKWTDHNGVLRQSAKWHDIECCRIQRSAPCGSNFVRKSLITTATGGGMSRYRLLDTTRAYAIEKLDESGERERLARCHAEYYRHSL